LRVHRRREPESHEWTCHRNNGPPLGKKPFFAHTVWDRKIGRESEGWTGKQLAQPCAMVVWVKEGAGEGFGAALSEVGVAQIGGAGGPVTVKRILARKEEN